MSEDTTLEENTTADNSVQGDGAIAEGFTTSDDVLKNGLAQGQDEEQEADTTLDEELKEEDVEAEVEVTGIPEGTFTPSEAPTDAEYLAVVNSSGFTKYVLPAEQALANALAGGYRVRLATTEEVAEFNKE